MSRAGGGQAAWGSTLGSGLQASTFGPSGFLLGVCLDLDLDLSLSAVAGGALPFNYNVIVTPKKIIPVPYYFLVQFQIQIFPFMSELCFYH